jgi:hypothetical protein
VFFWYVVGKECVWMTTGRIAGRGGGGLVWGCSAGVVVLGIGCGGPRVGLSGG